MTPLAGLMAARIAAAGPITIADFMAEALGHPQHGYYRSRDPLGAAGDFTTAPEISQMFGELVGLALAQAWLDQGAPAPCVLAELGPGRGTLMADALRATAHVPGFHAALRLHLVETSGPLRARASGLLPGATWHDTVADLPDGPLFLIANEFFDALPIRQFLRDGDGWAERVVGLSGGPLGGLWDDLRIGLGGGLRGGLGGGLRGGLGGGTRGGHLTFGLTPPAPLAALADRLDDVPQGGMVEVCATGQAIAASIGARIAAQGGAALIVDYGGWGSLGDTLQAVQNHAPAPPLAAPGQADLTAHVDFQALAVAARPARASALVAQGVFLARLGLGVRTARLAQNLTGAALDSHLAAYRRLTAPTEMGDLFKVIGLVPATAPLPPGLEP